MNNIIEASILNGKLKDEDLLICLSNQTFTVTSATRLYDDNQQSSKKIATTYKWTEFGKSMFLTYM